MTAKASSRIWIIKCGFASGRTSGAHGNKWGLGGGGGAKGKGKISAVGRSCGAEEGAYPERSLSEGH